MISPESLKSVIGSLLSGIDGENVELALPLVELEPVKDALQHLKDGEIDSFYFGLLYPLSRAVDGLLATELDTEDARFLVKHWRFVESHFEGLVTKFEGRACCVDKSRTILRHLLRFFTHSQPITFDYTQKYTYHLPRCIFTSHDDILMFYNGLNSLYYGNPERYLKALAELTPKAQAAADAREAEWLANLGKNTDEVKPT